MTKSKMFRQLLQSKDLEFICEVHNALSARVVEEAGFRAMWGSSLTISASMGVCDNNEASWTQILEIIEFTTDATSIPLLLDADTGYGNFNNVRRLVRKLEQRHVAAVCIEDKLFPKQNSFIRGECQPLASCEEFVGKIKAAKDTQVDPDFCVVARIEALVTGWGLGEALKRAEAYHRAGADAIIIHSKSSRPDEVLAFKKEWGDRCPVIIIPTSYFTTPTAVFRKAGFSAIIWANAILRSVIKAMKHTAILLAERQCLIDIDDSIAPLSEVFRLQRAEELQRLEELYLPGTAEATHSVILAASQGADLSPLTDETPKTLLSVAGRPLLYRQVEMLNTIGIKDIIVVRGFRKEMIDAPNLTYVDNDSYDTTQEVFSLYKGVQGLKGRTLVSYGDILCKKYIPSLLLETEGDFVVAVDPAWRSSRNKKRYIDLVSCDYPDRKEDFDKVVFLTSAGMSAPEENISGEWIGLIKLSARGLVILQGILADLFEKDKLAQLRMVQLFNELVGRGHRIRVVYVHGHWLDVDDIKDLVAASGTEYETVGEHTLLTDKMYSIG